MSRSFLALVPIAAVCAACSSSSSEGFSGGVGGGVTTSFPTTTTSTTTSTTFTTTTVTGTGGSGGADGGDAGGPCSDPTNPLLTSCIVPFLAGCWAPDLAGTCSDMNGVVSWSDGSKYVTQGSGAGLYAPGDTSPCILMIPGPSSVTGKKGPETLVYDFDASTMTATITCPDLSTVKATSAQVTAFNTCHGLNCP